jgi:signal transduction histidine kinase
MNTIFKRIILKIDHFIATAILLSILIVFFTLFHLWSTHGKQIELQNQRAAVQAEKLSSELDNTLNYITTVLHFLGKKVNSTETLTLEAISNLFNNQYIANKSVTDFFSWTGFDWVTPDYMLVASTMHGVMEKPIDMSFREYPEKCKAKPFTLHFDPPALGVPSRQWVIPSGFGIQNHQGEFVGLISLGINIAKLGNHLEKYLSHSGLEFIVVDHNMNVIYASNTTNENLSLLEKPLKEIENSFLVKKGTLENSFSFQNTDYSYYHKLNNHPFVLLVGYNKVIANNELYESIRSGGAQIVLLGILALLLILMLRNIVVQPVKRLSQAADDIVNRKTFRRIPRSTTHEINNLASKLLKLRRLIHKQDIIQQKLEMNRINSESDKEREAFMRDMYQRLKEPLKVLRRSIFIAHNQQLGPLSIEKYGIYFEAMHDACNQLESFTTELLYPTQVNVKETILQCVAIHRKYATRSNIAINTNIADNLPDIWADQLRLKQIILGAIYNSLLYVPENADKALSIDAAVIFDKQNIPISIDITLEDNGFGLSEEDREQYWEEFFNNENIVSQHTDIMNQSLSVIRHLVTLHHGSFSLTNQLGIGSKFSISLPYLNKNDLETHPDIRHLETQQKELEERQVTFHRNVRETLSHTNIIEFPKKK